MLHSGLSLFSFMKKERGIFTTIKGGACVLPLSLLGAMLFIADFTEEGRDYPDLVALREFLCSKPLDGDAGMLHFKKTLLKALDLSLAKLLESGRPIALKTVEARNAVLAGALLF